MHMSAREDHAHRILKGKSDVTSQTSAELSGANEVSF